MVKTAVASNDFPVTWPEVEAHMRHYYSKTIDQRLGQAYFNGLYEIYPEVADVVRGSDSDPFYAETFTDERFDRFFEVVISYFQ